MDGQTADRLWYKINIPFFLKKEAGIMKHIPPCMQIFFLLHTRERSGSVVECLTRDREAAVPASPGSLLCGPLARHIYPSLVLDQPRKNRPCLTERLLMGCKELNQTNKSFTHP